jgi:hypothetical protein
MASTYSDSGLRKAGAERRGSRTMLELCVLSLPPGWASHLSFDHATWRNGSLQEIFPQLWSKIISIPHGWLDEGLKGRHLPCTPRRL